MMKTKVIILIFTATILFLSCSGQKQQIIESIKTEMQYYPELQLKDIYKNFFQDAYGPGHLIPDTASAGKYLGWELSQPEWTDTVEWLPLGSKNDYFRINLSWVKNGILPRDTLLLGMVESAKPARNPDIETWKKEWNDVLSVVKEMHLNLPDFEKDKKTIDEVLSQGEVVMHHSEAYIKKYNPHYRIIHKSVFKRWQESYFK